MSCSNEQIFSFISLISKGEKFFFVKISLTIVNIVLRLMSLLVALQERKINEAHNKSLSSFVRSLKRYSDERKNL